jgi:hypothetical protein
VPGAMAVNNQFQQLSWAHSDDATYEGVNPPGAIAAIMRKRAYRNLKSVYRAREER